MSAHDLRWCHWSWQGLRLGIDQVDVLFVQNSVRKLFLEAVLVQELFNSPCYDRLLQDLINVRSPRYVHCEHLRDQSLQLSRKMSRERGVLSTNNLQSQEVKVHTFKRRLEGT